MYERIYGRYPDASDCKNAKIHSLKKERQMTALFDYSTFPSENASRW